MLNFYQHIMDKLFSNFSKFRIKIFIHIVISVIISFIFLIICHFSFPSYLLNGRSSPEDISKSEFGLADGIAPNVASKLPAVSPSLLLSANMLLLPQPLLCSAFDLAHHPNFLFEFFLLFLLVDLFKIFTTEFT